MMENKELTPKARINFEILPSEYAEFEKLAYINNFSLTQQFKHAISLELMIRNELKKGNELYFRNANKQLTRVILV